MNVDRCIKIYNGITGIREEIIEQAQTIHGKRALRRKWIRAAVVAACLCLAVGTAAALTAAELGTGLIRSFLAGVDSWESGYDLSVGIERVATGELTGEIQTVPEQIRKQYQEYNPYSSWFPGNWQKEFPTSKGARDFIGCSRMEGLSWELEEEGTVLRVLGNSKGQIQSIELETFYQVGNIRLQAYSRMFTEDYEGELTIGSRTTEYVEFGETFYDTKSGKGCHIISGTPMESGVQCADGFLVDGGVLHHLHIAYEQEDAREARRLLHQWAELF